MSVHFSRKSDEWQTPKDLFDQYNTEFGPFNLDVAATRQSRKVAKYYDKQADALGRP